MKSKISIVWGVWGNVFTTWVPEKDTIYVNLERLARLRKVKLEL